MSGPDETFEQRMRLVWFAVKLGMELTGNEERVLGKLNDLNELSIRCQAAEYEAVFFEALAICVIELKAVAVPFLHHESTIQPGGARSHNQLAWLRAQAHGPALFRNSGLLIEHCNHWVGSTGIKFG